MLLDIKSDWKVAWFIMFDDYFCYPPILWDKLPALVGEPPAPPFTLIEDLVVAAVPPPYFRLYVMYLYNGFVDAGIVICYPGGWLFVLFGIRWLDENGFGIPWVPVRF